MNTAKMKRFLIAVSSVCIAATAMADDPVTKAIQERLEIKRRTEHIKKGDTALVIARLAEQVGSQNYGERAEAAMALGELGFDACVEPLRNAFRDTESHVISKAIIGVDRANEKQKCSPIFRREAFAMLVSVFENKWLLGAQHRCALRLDRDRAITTMLEDRFFRADSPTLHHQMDAVYGSGARVPADRLETLIRDLAPQIKDEPFSIAYPRVLGCYALVRAANAEKLIRGALALTKEDAGALAQRHEELSEALLTAKGLHNVRDTIWERVDALGFEKLQTCERRFWAIREYWEETVNGGIVQYLCNTRAQQWDVLLEALDVIGARYYRAELTAIGLLLGPKGPAKKERLLDQQLDRLREKYDKDLDEIFETIEAPPGIPPEKDDVATLMNLWAADHADEFKKAWTKSRKR